MVNNHFLTVDKKTTTMNVINAIYNWWFIDVVFLAIECWLLAIEMWYVKKPKEKIENWCMNECLTLHLMEANFIGMFNPNKMIIFLFNKRSFAKRKFIWTLTIPVWSIIVIELSMWLKHSKQKINANKYSNNGRVNWWFH